MFDYLSLNQMYIVLCITLIIWGGILWYLFRLGRRLDRLEQQMKKD